MSGGPAFAETFATKATELVDASYHAKRYRSEHELLDAIARDPHYNNSFLTLCKSCNTYQEYDGNEGNKCGAGSSGCTDWCKRKWCPGRFDFCDECEIQVCTSHSFKCLCGKVYCGRSACKAKHGKCIVKE